MRLPAQASTGINMTRQTQAEEAPQGNGAAVLAVRATLTVGDAHQGEHQGEVHSPRALINGDEFVVHTNCVHDPMTVDVEVWLLSTDADDPTRQWHRKERVSWRV